MEFKSLTFGQWSLIGLTAVFILITFISGFEGVERNKKEHDSWTPTTCFPFNISSSSYRCCLVDACGCSECDLSKPVCESIESQPLNKSTCCGGYACCQTSCSRTCSLQHCSGTGSSRSCYYTSYCCENSCSQNVNHQTCSFRCGTCTTFEVTFRVEATNQITTGMQLKCGIDDLNCNTQYVSTYSKPFGCYYNVNSPNDVRLSQPDYNAGYKAGLAFVVIGSFVSIVLIIFTIVELYHHFDCGSYFSTNQPTLPWQDEKGQICDFSKVTNTAVDIPPPSYSESVGQMHIQPITGDAPQYTNDTEIIKPTLYEDNGIYK